MFLRKLLMLLLFMVVCLSKNGDFNLRYGSCKEEEGGMTLKCNVIPKNIRKCVLNVYVNLNLITDLVLTNSTFGSSNWSQVKVIELRESANIASIKLQDNCFEGLEGLEELRLHIHTRLVISPNAFVGLYHVKTLDMSASVRVLMNELIQAFNGSTKLPDLENLILSSCTLIKSSLVINETVVGILKSRNISHLDVSGCEISKLNLTAALKELKYLEVIIGSYVTVDDFDGKNLVQDDLRRIKTVDLSHIVLPKAVLPLLPGRSKITNITVKYSDIRNYEKLTLILTPETVNLSGFVAHYTSIWIDGCSVEIDHDPHLLTKTLIIRQNNLKRLDVNFVCDTFNFGSLERVDVSDNGLEFVHPSFVTCLPNLTEIDLSKNRLDKMSKENSQVFEQLFSRLTPLKNISLSTNELQYIPLRSFENCKSIEIIDLSNNKLEQVHFSLKELHQLLTLDLHGNNIHTLDSKSISYLNAIPSGGEKDDNHVSVILGSNPFSCAECRSKSSLDWLLTTNLVNLTSQRLTCLNEDGQWKSIGDNMLNEVETMCRRLFVILASSVSAGIVILIVVSVILIFNRRKRIANKLQNRVNVINLLREGNDSFEFAVFLTFSSDDEDFVHRNILHQLDENLQLMTGIDRELVCTGDRHFRPGFYVHNEAYRRLDTASVMVVVVSNNFCASEYCRSELDQAYIKRKPIVLMFIEHVDVNVMLPTMKELYQRNVRIVWTEENGVYSLKTTWENICTSILDLIK